MHRTPTTPGSVWAFLILALLPRIALASDPSWNQWRGPDRDGFAPGDPWPDSLGEGHLREVWRAADLGRSYSSPVVHGDVVYTTYGSRGAEGIVALDTETGESIWRTEWPVDFTMPGHARQHGSWPKSTPVVSREDLFFLGIDEHLYRLDATTGEVTWDLDFPAQFGTPRPEYGATSSPLVTDATVLVQAAGSLVSIERTTGAVRWRSYDLYADGLDVAEGDDEDELEAYGSPILTTIDGREQVVISTVKGIAGVDARSGEVLWETAANRSFEDSPNTTPVVWNDSLLITTESSGTPLYDLTRSEWGFSVREVWRSRVRGDMSSPVVAGDHAFLHLGNGRLACLDLREGTNAWISTPRFGPYVSLVSRGDKLLMSTTRGELLLLAADPRELRILDRRKVSDDTWAHLAVSGDRVFIRDHHSLVALEFSGRLATPPATPGG